MSSKPNLDRVWPKLPGRLDEKVAECVDELNAQSSPAAILRAFNVFQKLCDLAWESNPAVTPDNRSRFLKHLNERWESLRRAIWVALAKEENPIFAQLSSPPSAVEICRALSALSLLDPIAYGSDDGLGPKEIGRLEVHRTSIPKSLQNALRRHIRPFFESLGLAGIYDQAGKAPLTAQQCESVGLALTMKPYWFKYPVMDALLSRVEDLDTCGQLLAKADSWPNDGNWPGLLEPGGLDDSSVGHNLWALRHRFRIARAAGRGSRGVAAVIAKQLLKNYVAVLRTGNSVHVLGELAPYVRKDIRELLQAVADDLGPNAETKLSRVVALVRKAFVEAGHDSLAVQVERAWGGIRETLQKASKSRPRLSPASDDEAFYSAKQLAERFGVNKEALRKRLERFRKKNFDHVWMEVRNRRPRDAKYTYQLRAVKQIIKELRASGKRPSG